MRKTDISKYTDKIDVSPKKQSGVKQFFSVVGRVLLTVLMVLVIAGVIVGISLGIYVMKIAKEPTGIDLNARSLNLSSFHASATAALVAPERAFIASSGLFS